MLIEISGANFGNKGAELMIIAIIEALKNKKIKTEIAMQPFKNTYKKRAEKGLYQKIWFYKYGLQLGYLGNIIPKKIRELYGMVTDSEINVVLDASGFAHGDQWGKRGEEISIRKAKEIKKWKKQKTKVIFMPQAFGPFTREKLRLAMKEIIDGVDLIFARDTVSYNHLIAISGEKPKIKKSPDFTNILEGILPQDFLKDKYRVAIIPNMRMLDKTAEPFRSKYIPFLIKSINYLLDKNKYPFFLIHEGPPDKELAKEINKKIKAPIDIIEDDNPLHLKGIIGACQGVISSRFHGLVSALSQAVPSLGTGWTHKYKELFQDYSFPEGLISVMADDNEIKRKIDMITEEQSNKEIREKLKITSLEQKKLTEKMWDDIFAIIKK